MTGPLYHGGRARLREGDFLLPGQRPNPWGDTFDARGRSLYVYCTEDLGTAQNYADAISRATGRVAYVYEVLPTGTLLPDYSGSDYKSLDPLLVVRRVSP
jgi:hypothetical protein